MNDDTLSHIFNYVVIKDIKNVASVCKQYNKLIMKDSFWKSLFEYDSPKIPRVPLFDFAFDLIQKDQQPNDFKQKYKNFYETNFGIYQALNSMSELIESMPQFDSQSINIKNLFDTLTKKVDIQK